MCGLKPRWHACSIIGPPPHVAITILYAQKSQIYKSSRSINLKIRYRRIKCTKGRTATLRRVVGRPNIHLYEKISQRLQTHVAKMPDVAIFASLLGQSMRRNDRPCVSFLPCSLRMHQMGVIPQKIRNTHLIRMDT